MKDFIIHGLAFVGAWWITSMIFVLSVYWILKWRHPELFEDEMDHIETERKEFLLAIFEVVQDKEMVNSMSEKTWDKLYDISNKYEKEYLKMDEK